jgi:hypothetical protein
LAAAPTRRSQGSASAAAGEEKPAPSGGVDAPRRVRDEAGSGRDPSAISTAEARATAAIALAATAALRVASAPAAPPLPAATPAVPPLAPLPSPTDGGAASLLGDVDYWGLVAAPLSFYARAAAVSFARVAEAALAAAAAAASAASARAAAPRSAAAGAAEALMAERAFYGLAVAHVPAHVVVYEKQQSATNLFGAGALRSARYTFKGDCKPELHAAASTAGAQPAFVGELKSVDSGMLGQALYYALMAMTGAFFPGEMTGALGRRVFYAAPPLCFVLLGFPHVGYFASVEWVGKALVAPASLPFFLGSAEHAAAAAALPAAPRGSPAWEFDAAAPWRAAFATGA